MGDFLHPPRLNVKERSTDLTLRFAFYRAVLGLPLETTPDQGFRSQFFRDRPTSSRPMTESRGQATSSDGHFA